MSKKNNRIPVHTHQKAIQFPVAAMNQMVALYNSGQWDLLAVMARDATKRHPQHVFGWKALSVALLMSGKPSEALNSLNQWVKITPNDPDAYSDLANAYNALGKFDEAEKCYRLILKINPKSSLVYDKLGALYCEVDRFEEAEAAFRSALEIDPKFVQAHINLGFTVDSLGRFDEAEKCYRRALEINPDFVEAHKRLGDHIARTPSRRTEAIACIERAIALSPGDMNLLLSLGNILMAENRINESNVLFRRAQLIQPFVTWPSKKKDADFSVLLLDAPQVGSTPMNYLVGRAGYASYFFAVLPDTEYNLELLRSKADVVINMISDADNGRDVLPLVLDLADRIGRPTVNHPRLIIGTDRETIASRLSGIALCRIPKTVRLSSAVMAENNWQKFIEGFTMPLLIRCAGTHGGDDFEKIDDISAIHPFVSQHPDSNFYVSEFIDYRSDDGYYRKYRLIFINNEILPYHLAIHSHWLVHHFRTDMANQLWMRHEEEAFLKDPHVVFNKEHYIALRAITAAIGLDYCGIDCSLDREGNIVIFEANATMRVHDEKNPIFLYKNPYIAKIKDAFDAMLTRLAASR